MFKSWDLTSLPPCLDLRKDTWTSQPYPPPPATGSAPTPMTFQWFPHSPFFLPGSGGKKGWRRHALASPVSALSPQGCWWALPAQAGRPGRRRGRPLPPGAPRGRPVPVWAALTPRRRSRSRA